MAKASTQVIQAIRNVAGTLQKTSGYQWGHMGSCNCGFLAQEITNLSKSEIHARAMQKYGDWNDQLNDYCPDSGLLMDDLITKMLDFGFSSDDLKHLEKLSDPLVLEHPEVNGKYLHLNRKEDVIIYLNAWATLLEDKLLNRIKLPEIEVIVENADINS